MGRAENKNIAISFENVSKMYRLGLVGTGTLGQDLNRWWRMSVLLISQWYKSNEGSLDV